MPMKPITTLSELMERALNTINDKSDLSEIGKAIDIAQKAAGAEQALFDVATRTKKARLEYFKSFSTLLVPTISLLALVATVLIQAIQIHFQNELQFKQALDQQWTDFLKSQSFSSDSHYTDPSFVPRLRFFISQPFYHDEAVGIAINVLGSIANKPGFTSLLGVTFPAIDDENVSHAVRVLELSQTTLNQLANQCRLEEVAAGVPDAAVDTFLGLCTSKESDNEVAKVLSNKPQLAIVSQLRTEVSDVEDQQTLLSSEVATYLRNRYGSTVSSVTRSQEISFLKDSYLYQADLSGVDFAQFDLSNAQIEYSKLDGAVLQPRDATNLWLWGSNWWTSREISRQVLRDLLRDQNSEISNRPNKVIFNRALIRLCKPYKDLTDVCTGRLMH